MAEVKTPFRTGASATMRAFQRSIGSDKLVKWMTKGETPRIITKIGKFSEATGISKVASFTGRGMSKAGAGLARMARSSVSKGIARGGFKGVLVLGSVAMVAVGMMRGTMNPAQEIIKQRYIQDQRYARNITMMSRLGYSSGTSSMNKYNHTDGLSLAMSTNRHGRGGY